MNIVSAKKAWLGLAIYILFADLVLIKRDLDTLSKQFSAWAHHPIKRFIAGLICGYIICHLYELPYLKRCDPLSLLADLVRGRS